jgi:hypothetical protein
MRSRVRGEIDAGRLLGQRAVALAEQPTLTSGRPDRNAPENGQYLWIKPIAHCAGRGTDLLRGMARF